MTELRSIQLLATWKSALHKGGFRVTKPRLQVMEIITSSPSPLTPQEIFQKSLELQSPPGIASVYRTLEMLEELNLIQQIHRHGGCHGIWPALDGHKHFLICTDCGNLQVIEGNDEIADYIHRIEAKTGYTVDEHWLQLFGLCENCSR